MRRIEEIIIHCSYTPPSMAVTADLIRKWHVDERGWDDIGYHFVITRTGEIQYGRPIGIQGAHVYGHNDYTIGICMAGGMAEDEKTPDCNFTRWQWEALETLVDDLTQEYGDMPVSGHRDYDANKACPCFDAREWAGELE